MDFEFDPKKNEGNKQKHGIDFKDAQELWDDPDLIEIPLKTTDDKTLGNRVDFRETLVGNHYL